MELARRTRWLALSLPVALAAAAALARPAPPGVLGAAPVATRACDSGSAAVDTADAGWSRLDPMLDSGGTLTGQRLSAGRGAARWTETLPPESFAAAPVAGRVLVGDDDGRRSRVRLLDTTTGCWTAVAAEADVVRSGLLSADGAFLYEHRVERGSRRDLGVWRVAAGGRHGATAVLPGMAPDPVYGRTFATSLLLAADGRLVVSSCGLEACRIRVVDPISRATARVDGTGPAVRLTSSGLVVQEACDGLPCPLDSIDLTTGARTRLAEVLP